VLSFGAGSRCGCGLPLRSRARPEAPVLVSGPRPQRAAPRLYFLCLAQVDGAGQDSRARERFPLCLFGFRRSASSVRLREAQLRADFAVPARGQQSPYLISHLYFRRDKALFSCPANHATQCGIKAMSSGECKRMRKETPVVAPCIGCKPRKGTP
jgi:hypothetical protein